MLFAISDDHTKPPHHVVRVRGELDIATAPALRAHLMSLIEDGQTNPIVDLDELEFIDSSGLGVLVGAYKRLHALNGELVLICSNDRVLKVLAITGLDSVFSMHRTTATVIAG